MSRISRGSSLDFGSPDHERQLPPTPRQEYNNRDSFATTTSNTSDATTTSNSTFTGSYTDTLTSEGSSSRRYSDRRSSSTSSSVVQAEIFELENMIYKFKEQLDLHKRRADTEERRANDAERKVQEYAEHLAKVNKARIVAQQEANKANEELRLYKLQLEYAQGEINRAQGVLDLVEKQRYMAEKEASEAKAKARKLNEELVVENARREGRRQGLQEGLNRGRDLILQETQGANVPHRRTSSALDRSSSTRTRESFITDSDDTRTISTESYVSIQADRRPRERPRSYVPSEPASPPPLPVPEPRPPSRVASVASGYVPSKAPSLVASERPASRAASVAHTHPPLERVTSPSESRPPSAQGHTPIPRYNAFVPPDNLIPNLELDGVIRLPPPHGFHKMSHTPERQPSPPAPSQRSDSQPSISIHRHPSPDSASTTLSHLDLLKDPNHGYVAITPALSAIQEVSSQASPYSSNPYDIRHQSVAGSSVGRGGGSIANSPYIGSEHGGSQMNTHHRNGSTSTFVPSIHERAPSIVSSKHASSARGTPIHIDIQPPSLTASDGTRSISKSELSPLPHDTVLFSSSFTGFSAQSPAGSSTHSMPGVFDKGSQRGAPSPVNFAPTEKDDDAVSSRISGDEDFFTTPPPSGAAQSLSKRAESVVSMASAKTSKTSKTSKSKASRNR